MAARHNPPLQVGTLYAVGAAKCDHLEQPTGTSFLQQRLLKYVILIEIGFMEKLDSIGYRIVCLGGSAGALEAYIEILRELPCDTGMAFLIASHRGTEEPELLGKVLSRVTKMPVIEVVGKTLIEQNKVFLAPPRRDMTINGSELELHPASKAAGWPQSITVLLNSMAATLGRRTIAVILSGMGYDGSKALANVKSAGGTTLAQSNAACPDMPMSAMETGYVDLLTTPSNIAAELVRMGRENCDELRSAVLADDSTSLLL